MKNNKLNIKFGTDGWRAVIADDFTFDNVHKVAEAISVYSKKSSGKKNPLLTVGYDTRFHSRAFAETVSKTLGDNGCKVILSSKYLSTPALSSSVVSEKAFGGVMISASHNPPEFNGIKFKTSKGCSAPEDVTKAIENNLNSASKKISTISRVKEKELTKDYLKRLASSVDFKAIAKKKLTIIADPMYGSSLGYLDELLSSTNCKVISIHNAPDPVFGGLHPEPIEENLSDLKNAVRKFKANVGLATDGDGDRIGVVDENGRYLTPHQVFPLILYYLCKYKGLRGKVVQSISLGYLSERIASDYRLDWEEVPVGFKYIAEKIVNEKILFGGEESGGYGYGSYLPERDGILNSLVIAEILANTGKKLSLLVKEMEKKYGSSCYLRTDFKNPGIPKNEFVERVKYSLPKKIVGLNIKKVKDYDGIEFVLEDGSWLLLRPSGTEPVIRVYCESETFEKTEKIILWGKKLVSKLLAL